MKQKTSVTTDDGFYQTGQLRTTLDFAPTLLRSSSQMLPICFPPDMPCLVIDSKRDNILMKKITEELKNCSVGMRTEKPRPLLNRF
jgi:hypothetical protein